MSHVTLFSFIIINIIFMINGLMLNCNFAVRDTLYSCEATVVFFGHERNLTQVSNNHNTGRNSSDVKLLIIQNQLQLTVVPRNIYQFFPNLQSLRIINSSLGEISRDDLRGLSSLRRLNLDDARIAEIGNDLFFENSLMTYISITGNPIHHVAQQIFDHLANLGSLNFSRNTCIDVAASNRAGVLSIMFQIILNCPPTVAMLEEKILNGAGLKKTIEQQIDPLKGGLENNQNRIEFLEQQVEQLFNMTIEYENLQGQIIALENEVGPLINKTIEMEERLESLSNRVAFLEKNGNNSSEA